MSTAARPPRPSPGEPAGRNALAITALVAALVLGGVIAHQRSEAGMGARAAFAHTAASSRALSPNAHHEAPDDYPTADMQPTQRVLPAPDDYSAAATHHNPQANHLLPPVLPALRATIPHHNPPARHHHNPPANPHNHTTPNTHHDAPARHHHNPPAHTHHDAPARHHHDPPANPHHDAPARHHHNPPANPHNYSSPSDDNPGTSRWRS